MEPCAGVYTEEPPSSGKSYSLKSPAQTVKASGDLSMRRCKYRRPAAQGRGPRPHKCPFERDSVSTQDNEKNKRISISPDFGDGIFCE